MKSQNIPHNIHGAPSAMAVTIMATTNTGKNHKNSGTRGGGPVGHPAAGTRSDGPGKSANSG